MYCLIIWWWSADNLACKHWTRKQIDFEKRLTDFWSCSYLSLTCNVRLLLCLCCWCSVMVYCVMMNNLTMGHSLFWHTNIEWGCSWSCYGECRIIRLNRDSICCRLCHIHGPQFSCTLEHVRKQLHTVEHRRVGFCWFQIIKQICCKWYSINAFYFSDMKCCPPNTSWPQGGTKLLLCVVDDSCCACLHWDTVHSSCIQA